MEGQHRAVLFRHPFICQETEWSAKTNHGRSIADGPPSHQNFAKRMLSDGVKVQSRTKLLTPALSDCTVNKCNVSSFLTFKSIEHHEVANK
jgi:hypothetical protein